MKKMTLEQFKEQFNIKLNNQQLKAVQSVQNPTLLLAVPGSGKTTVLVTRLGMFNNQFKLKEHGGKRAYLVNQFSLLHIQLRQLTI